MAKLCPRGKAAAKRKFKVYPSAYANMYASAVCSGKVTPGGKKKRKKAMGGGVMDMTRMRYLKGGTFPDLNKDGKTSFADVLVGRGVLPKPKGKKKKFMAKKSESPMDKAVRKKNKKRFV